MTSSPPALRVNSARPRVDQLNIRPLQPLDIAAVARVVCRAWQSAYRGVLANDLLDSLTESAFQERWSRTLEQTDPERRLWVGEQDSDVRGVCSTGLSRDVDKA